jgi:hypothetical protein
VATLAAARSGRSPAVPDDDGAADAPADDATGDGSDEAPAVGAATDGEGDAGTAEVTPDAGTAADGEPDVGPHAEAATIARARMIERRDAGIAGRSMGG